ncbi:MAG: hypothetical protein LUQ22_09150 [Methanotrichaceae archaeon]|nr:hypothetical protein [Methanotrichaceae archaeon]
MKKGDFMSGHYKNRMVGKVSSKKQPTHPPVATSGQIKVCGPKGYPSLCSAQP